MNLKNVKASFDPVVTSETTPSWKGFVELMTNCATMTMCLNGKSDVVGSGSVLIDDANSTCGCVETYASLKEPEDRTGSVREYRKPARTRSAKIESLCDL